jgi:two-component system, OmpR family, phosphate regulon response regulator PhoB
MSKRILVVEDNTAIRELMLYILKMNGYETLSATRGDAAIESAECNHPDLILMDVMIPPQDGCEICRRLKKHASLASIPVILVSAKGQKNEMQAGLDAGAAAYLVKPFEPDELSELVQKYTGGGEENAKKDSHCR